MSASFTKTEEAFVCFKVFLLLVFNAGQHASCLPNKTEVYISLTELCYTI